MIRDSQLSAPPLIRREESLGGTAIGVAVVVVMFATALLAAAVANATFVFDAAPALPTLASTDAALGAEPPLATKHSDWSKWLFTGAVLADLGTTLVGLDRGLVEGGPIWGSLGSDGIWLSAAVDVALIWGRHRLGKRFPHWRWWRLLDLFMSAPKLGGAWSNAEKILER